jgi:type II secretory pathway component PulM
LAVAPINKATRASIRCYLTEVLQDAKKVEPRIGKILVGMGSAVVSGLYIAVYEDGEEDVARCTHYHPGNRAKPKHEEVKKLLDAVESYRQAIVDNELPDVGDIEA